MATKKDAESPIKQRTHDKMSADRASRRYRVPHPTGDQASSLRELKVWVNETPVGVIARSNGPGRNTTFRYLPGITKDMSVSLTMQVTGESISYPGGLHPIFRQNMPEGDTLDFVTTKLSKVADSGMLDDLDLLRASGGTQIGRLRVTEVGQTTPPSGPGALDFEQLVGDSNRNLVHEMLDHSLEGVGVSGAQPKMLIQSQDTNQPDPAMRDNENTEPGYSESKMSVGSAIRAEERDHRHAVARDGSQFVRGDQYIVKGWGDNFPELATNEFFCMRAAEIANMDTPAFWLSSDRERLVVERFDAEINDSGEHTGRYYGFEEACSLLGCPPTEKYARSYEDVARAIRLYVGPKYKRDAQQQLYDTLILSSMVENGDFHMKNTGVLYDDASSTRNVVPAPVYDVVTTTVYLPSDQPALSINGAKRWFGEQDLVTFGRNRCGLSRKQAHARLETIAAAVTQAAHEMAEYARAQPGGLASFVEQMGKSWSRGVQRLDSVAAYADDIRRATTASPEAQANRSVLGDDAADHAETNDHQGATPRPAPGS